MNDTDYKLLSDLINEEEVFTTKKSPFYTLNEILREMSEELIGFIYMRYVDNTDIKV